MPYTAHTWINGDSANTTKLNNLEQQYTEATLSFGPDVFTAGFVLSGYTPSGTVGTTTVNVAGGTAYLLQADGTTRQRKQNATTQTTSALSSTYNLYLQPDGTWYWSTSNSPAANSLYVAQVTTNGSGQIATVTDKRSLTPNLFPGSAASPTFPTGIAATAPSSFDTALIRTDGLGALSLSPPAAPAAPILATAVSSGDTYRTTTLADTPTRYYRLDESAGTTAADSSGNAQTGTYVGGPTLLVTGALTGDTDTAITLNGTSQYVTVPAAGLATGANAWSLECWLKFASNPASNKILMSFGDQGVANGAPQLILDTTGHVTVNSNGTGTGAGAALTTGVWHHLVGTYDGTTLRMYVDGALSGTTATVTCAVPNPPPFATIGGSAAGSPGFLTAGSLDEAEFYNTALSSTRVSAHYTAGTSTPASVAQSMQLAAGTRVKFGSPAWGAIQTWQVRFRYYSGATDNFFAHYTDANNYLVAQVTGTTLALVQSVGGVGHTLATATISPGNEVPYWLRVTQFPTVTGNPPMVSATLYLDAGGAVGTQVATVGPVATNDAVTALVGAPQISCSGAALGIGGNYASVHTVSLFGPGGWTFGGKLGTATGLASGSWDGSRIELGMSGNSGNTFATGPVTSFGAARIDAGPAGTLDAKWNLYSGGTPAGTQAIPVKTAGDVMYAAAAMKSSGLGNGATIKLVYAEYDANGASLRTGTLGAFTVSGGTQASYPSAGKHYSDYTLSGTWTTGASCAYADLGVEVADTTSGSVNATVWIDNVLCWDATNTANGETNMGYHELRFPNSPAQLMVSGLLGDMWDTPALLALGTYFTGSPGTAQVIYRIGRLKTPAAGAVLASPQLATIETPILDGASWGGFYTSHVGTGQWLDLTTAWSGLLASSFAGTYHVLTRYRTTATASAVTAQVQYYEAAIDGSASGGVSFVPVAAASFLTATATWTLADLGQIAVPVGAQQGLSDLTQIAEAIMPQYAGVGNGDRVNFLALLPIDSSILSGGINPANLMGAGQYTWLYFDGLGLYQQAGTSPRFNQGQDFNQIPNPSSAVAGTGTTRNVFPTLNSGADPWLQLDPTTKVGATVVNQMLATMTDTSGTLGPMPINAEIQYTPLYLWPR